MWIIVLFDLPTDTPEARLEYTQFRKGLLKDSFIMMQYSVYMRHCNSDENAMVHANRVRASLPADGEVRIIKITDQQFGRIEVYYGKKRRPTENAPSQLAFF
ncbi:CRISPR-associated endonuclease Cas2 [Shewanella sp. KX20019]|uniref:CRISPR-associated endonuclease Cas2 n=1 Tax=Shewanella sp. KX20019 TaxID=2803864 RepID=UPI00192920E5|nr:CRISPR-associated endonuclease Cas2 [Shewanella sp. KX20019]QQX81675.1 CRISPR-associated endonuclease Cas2 [Shewanella sp. KX20019]